MLDDPIFLHFEHEDWKPIMMLPVKYKEKSAKKSVFGKKKRKWGKWGNLKMKM